MDDKCIWCGKTREEHEDDYEGRPVPRVPCLMLKASFSAKRSAPTEEELSKMHSAGKPVECDMPKCQNKTVFPRKFCDDCQLLTERVDYVAGYLGYFKP
jgi:hypothetical protein